MGKWFCLLQWNKNEYAAFTQLAQHAPVEDLEQFLVRLGLTDALRHYCARECPCPWQRRDVPWVEAVLRRKNLSLLSVQEQLVQG